MGSIAKLSFLWLLLNAASAWKVDPRCPDPVNRRLEEGADVEEDVGFDDFLPEDDFPVSAIPNFLTDMSSGALRGQHRDLKAGPDVFAVKMYWEAGFCWQEEYDLHREWCWECKGSGCSDGKGLWWQKCDSKDKKQQFSYIPSSTNGDGQFRWAHDNLCLQRVSGFRYEMKRCSTHPNQIIVGFNANSPFEMFPKGDRDKCINQHHHPKAGEIVENTRCKTARYWKTNLMELVSISETGNPPDDDNSRKIEDPNAVRLRKPQCTNNKKCERCEGDCDRDSHCQGNLICYQRRGLTKYVPVPGCGGDPRPGMFACICCPLCACRTSLDILSRPLTTCIFQTMYNLAILQIRITASTLTSFHLILRRNKKITL